MNEDCVWIDCNLKDHWVWNVREPFTAFGILMDLLMNRDIKTNSIKITYFCMSDRYMRSKSEIKKILFKLKSDGILEIYKTNHKDYILIAFRKNELFDVGDYELVLDKSLEVPVPKSRSRNDVGYDKFRKSVLKRDNYACQLCGAKENLEVHHKKSYSKFPLLRTSVGNGITLCETCHDKVHSKEVVL